MNLLNRIEWPQSVETKWTSMLEFRETHSIDALFFFERQFGASEYLTCHQGTKSLNPSPNHLTKRISTPSLAIQFPIKGLQGIALGFEPGCHFMENPPHRESRSRTPDLPHMETITGCINPTDALLFWPLASSRV